jgi:hypothetical protein
MFHISSSLGTLIARRARERWRVVAVRGVSGAGGFDYEAAEGGFDSCDGGGVCRNTRRRVIGVGAHVESSEEEEEEEEEEKAYFRWQRIPGRTGAGGMSASPAASDHFYSQ